MHSQSDSLLVCSVVEGEIEVLTAIANIIAVPNTTYNSYTSLKSGTCEDKGIRQRID